MEWLVKALSYVFAPVEWLLEFIGDQFVRLFQHGFRALFYVSLFLGLGFWAVFETLFEYTPLGNWVQDGVDALLYHLSPTNAAFVSWFWTDFLNMAIGQQVILSLVGLNVSCWFVYTVVSTTLFFIKRV